MLDIKRSMPLLALLALTLIPFSSQADGSLNTRHERQAGPLAQPSYEYRPLPQTSYHYPRGGNDVIIIRRDPGPRGYDIYQRNVRRHRQGYAQEPVVDQRPKQCLGNHCGND